MEMQIVRRNSVDRRLDRCYGVECRMRALANLVRNRNDVYQPMNLGHLASMRLRRNVEIDLHTFHCRPLHFRDAHSHPIESDRRRESRDPDEIEAYVDK